MNSSTSSNIVSNGAGMIQSNLGSGGWGGGGALDPGLGIGVPPRV